MTGPSAPPDPDPNNRPSSPNNQSSPTSGPPPPVAETPALPGVSYSAKLKVNVNRNERLKRNVLEINLDIDHGSSPNIENEIVARLLGDWESILQLKLKDYKSAQETPGKSLSG